MCFQACPSSSKYLSFRDSMPIYIELRVRLEASHLYKANFIGYSETFER